MKSILLLLCALLLSSCTTTTTNTTTNTVLQREGDLKKAAEYNADLGSQYFQAGDLKKARDKLTKALDQDSENPRANFSYAMLLARVKQPSEAETYFRRAISLSPDETHYNDAFGVFLCGLDRYEDAKEQFLASATNPYNEIPEYAYNNAGSCAMKLGRIDDAQANTREALRKNPRFTPALLNLAEISLEQRKVDVADAYYSRYLKYGQHTADSLWLGVQIKRFLGDREAIEEYGLRLKRDFPQSAETLQYLESKQL